MIVKSCFIIKQRKLYLIEDIIAIFCLNLLYGQIFTGFKRLEQSKFCCCLSATLWPFCTIAASIFHKDLAAECIFFV